MTSISGLALDADLCNIIHDAKLQYDPYKKDFVQGGKFGRCKLTPIFVIPEERHIFFSIESRTVNAIMKLVNEISALPDVDLAANLSATVAENKRPKKQEALDMYYNVSSILEEQLITSTVADVDVHVDL
jgi:(2Fe-2S) ferredoxin